MMEDGVEIFGTWFAFSAWYRAVLTAVIVGIVALAAHWVWRRRQR